MFARCLSVVDDDDDGVLLGDGHDRLAGHGPRVRHPEVSDSSGTERSQLAQGRRRQAGAEPGRDRQDMSGGLRRPRRLRRR